MLSSDPIVPDFKNPQSLNSYAYVFSNPVNLTDPSGLDPWWCDKFYPGIPSHGQRDAAANCRKAYYESVLKAHGIVANPAPSPRIVSYNDMLEYRPFINQAAAAYNVPPIAVAAGIMHQGSSKIRFLIGDVGECFLTRLPFDTRGTGAKASVGIAQLESREIARYIPGCDVNCLFQTDKAIEGLAAKLQAADVILPADIPPLDRLMVLAIAQNNGPQAGNWYIKSLENLNDGNADNDLPVWAGIYDLSRDRPNNWRQLGHILEVIRYLESVNLFDLPPGVAPSDLETWEEIYNSNGQNSTMP